MKKAWISIFVALAVAGAALAFAAPVHATTAGTFPMFGGSTGWDDSQTPPLTIQVGVAAPDPCTLLGDASMTGFRCFAGTGVTVEEATGTMQASHRIQPDSTVYPHVHWAPTTADAGNVVWQLEITCANVNSVFPATSVVECTADPADGTAWTHQIAGCGTGVTGCSGISSILAFRVFRDPAHASDTYEADAALLGVDYHFYANDGGSRQPTSK